MSQSIAFYGAAETVTGSRHLLTLNGKKVLVDCGLFQGRRELRERNWAPFPVDPTDIDAIVITHAHMDHIGYLPRLVKNGYRGPIYSTAATAALARISLPDSGRIQEEDARYHNKHRLSKHEPALPLYTERDAYDCLKQFEKVKFDTFNELPGNAQWRFLPAGHILGSAFAEIYFENGERIMMSGDLGRYNTPIIKDPTTIELAEYLTIESTYGDRFHADESAADRIEQIFKQAYQNGSVVLVPTFSIGRTQELLYFIHELQDENRIPRIPIYVDSPMAISSTDLYRQATEEHDEEIKIHLDAGHKPLDPENVMFIRDREQSKAVNSQSGPFVVIAGSGMANGGRIIHHLLHRLSDPNNIVLFTGYQAEGTLGREILEGNPVVRIHKYDVEVRAEVQKLNSLSAHADQGEMMAWLRNFKSPPRRTFIVHGEPPAQAVLRQKIESELGWDVVIPHQGQSFDL